MDVGFASPRASYACGSDCSAGFRCQKAFIALAHALGKEASASEDLHAESSSCNQSVWFEVARVESSVILPQPQRNSYSEWTSGDKGDDVLVKVREHILH